MENLTILIAIPLVCLGYCVFLVAMALVVAMIGE